MHAPRQLPVANSRRERLSPIDLLARRPQRIFRGVIDSSHSELLAEQAVDDASSDDETEDDEIRCQAWPGFYHCRLLCCPRRGRIGSFVVAESESTYARAWELLD